MTMHYAKTLAVTAEREFLRYKKVTADGRTAEVDPSDLYDLLHLDQRADRVLPNGWCMLPPKQVCSKGNACLTCDKFVTDASHRDELQHQLQQSEALIARRQTQFAARHGEPMGEDNIWLAGRLSETRALTQVLVALDQIGVHDDGQLRAVRGAGAADRPEPLSATNHRSRPHDATAGPPPASHPRPEPRGPRNEPAQPSLNWSRPASPSASPPWPARPG